MKASGSRLSHTASHTDDSDASSDTSGDATAGDADIEGSLFAAGSAKASANGHGAEASYTATHITLTRELRSNGRSSARVNGISTKTEVLREIGDILVDIHGQNTHLSLFKARTHIDLLDRYANLLEVRSALATVVTRLNGIRSEITELETDKDALQRKADRLRYEIDEIEAARLRPDEEETIVDERNRLANSEQLATLASEADLLLSGDDESELPGMLDMAQQLSVLMTRLSNIDRSMAEDAALVDEMSANIQELSLTIGGYNDDLEYDPNRLNELEERIELIRTLKRRYNCSTIEEIIAYAATASAELEGIEHSDERLEKLKAEEDKTLHHIGDLAHRLSQSRRVAGEALGRHVVDELQDLRMANTRFEIINEHVENEAGCYVDEKRYSFTTSGIDNLEFMMSANPGEPLRPLARVASGGEAARIMLALKRVLAEADETPLLIFDEIDQGIGGRIGSVVGEKLWSLTDNHQVMVVSHLPQLASFGDQHFHVAKVIEGNRTRTRVDMLVSDEQRASEIAAMLGTSGDAGQQSARDILELAHTRKASHTAPSG